MATILLVDDSELSRNVIKRTLGAGHTYLEAADGVAGLERYTVDRPDLVILDLTMPGMHGLEVLAKLREFDPAATVVVGTADVQASSRERARALGAAHFVHKPFEPDELRQAVEHALVGRG